MECSYLCGGVLFFLLTQATYANGNARNHRDGIKDNHSNPILMADLVYTFTGDPNFPQAEKDASRYKDCLSEGSINVPFNEVSRASNYDYTVKNKYSDALSRMSEFVNWHIDLERKEWLVKAILDLIENDNEILETDAFYIKKDGRPVAKQGIRKMSNFDLQPFLVGVLHFILIHRMNKNGNGVSTLNALGIKRPYKERIYNGNAGDGVTRPISVEYCDISDIADDSDSTDAPAVEAAIGKSPNEILNERILASGRVFADAWGRAIKGIADGVTSGESHAESDIPEAEAVDDETPSNAATNQSVTIIQSQTIVEHDESKTFNIKGSNVTFNL